MRGSGKGWVTAEYSMLPARQRSGVTRGGQRQAIGEDPGDPAPDRPVVAGRLRPRGTREMQVTVDCDVLQADAGRGPRRSAVRTWRCTTPSAGCSSRACCAPPLTDAVAAVSVASSTGLHARSSLLGGFEGRGGHERVMTEPAVSSRCRHGRGLAFSRGELDQLLELAESASPAAHASAVLAQRPLAVSDDDHAVPVFVLATRTLTRHRDRAILARVALRPRPSDVPRWSRTARPSSTTLG